MKITTLIENTSINENLVHEHGLSLLIESGGNKILFDTGQSGKFINNAESLNIKLKDLDFIVLSHGHYDHGGGLKRILELNNKVQVYMNQNVFKHYYHTDKYIGLDKQLKQYSDRFILTKDEFQIADNIKLSTANHKSPVYPIETFNLLKEENNKLKPDDFQHEQYLEILEDDKKILISGCSHKGILNIMNWFKPDILIGGFHLMEIPLNKTGKKQLDLVSEELSKFDTDYYTCHCTGLKQFNYLENKMDRLNYLSTGKVIEI